MGNITLSNHQWLVKSFDTNNNGTMDELKADARIMQAVDTNSDGKIATAELVNALQADKVEINQGQIVESKGSRIFVNGLETLKNVNATARNSWGNVWAPTLYQDDTLEDRYSKLMDSNRAYGSAVSRQESALRSIRDMTSNATDATSRALHIQAKTALQSASWRTWMSVIDRMGNDGYTSESNVSQLQQANTNLQAAYETLNNTLRAISEQTKDLPDVHGAIKATDASIANAFSNIQAIRTAPQTPQQVHGRLNQLADTAEAESGGRAAAWGGIGAGVGAVGGGLIGFFAGGKNAKSAAIGAGVGLAVAGGGGALAGHLRDKAYLEEARSLRSLAQDVTSYNPAAAEAKLMPETQSLYNGVLKARETNDLDNARVHTNEINAIQGRVNPVANEAARILGAYKK